MYGTEWVGLYGNPKTATISMHKPIKRTILGYGISVLNYKMCVSDETQIALDFSYHFFLIITVLRLVLKHVFYNVLAESFNAYIKVF